MFARWPDSFLRLFEGAPDWPGLLATVPLVQRADAAEVARNAFGLVTVEVPWPPPLGEDDPDAADAILDAVEAARAALRVLALHGVAGVCPVLDRFTLSGLGHDLLDPFDAGQWAGIDAVKRGAAGTVVVLPLDGWTADAALFRAACAAVAVNRRVFVLTEGEIPE